MGSQHRWDRVRRRYLSLGTGELAAAVVFVALAVTVVIPRLDSRRDATALWFALVPLLVVLLQAGVYWLWARNWVGHTTMPPTLATTYRVFRVVDPVLFVGGLVGVLVCWPDRLGAALTIAAVWVFGVVEYVNYFIVRLAYPAAQWLTTVGQRRTPRLARDLRISRPRSSGVRA